jgi:hypothetical protein
LRDEWRGGGLMERILFLLADLEAALWAADPNLLPIPGMVLASITLAPDAYRAIVSEVANQSGRPADLQATECQVGGIILRMP